MKSANQIKQQIISALTSCGIFDNVIAPPDDKQEDTIMREPAASVFFSGFSQVNDNGIPMLQASFSIYMKFLKIGLNDTTEDIELAVNAVSKLEPSSLSQKKTDSKNNRSALYIINVSFTGCRL